MTMGSYGIGITRVLAALAEENHDEKGLAWPVQVAPAQVHIVATGKDDAVFSAAQELAEALDADGIEVLLDDRRKVSAGVKFADFELLGVPFGVIVGKGLAEGNIEIRERRGETTVLPLEAARERIVELVRAAIGASDSSVR